MSYKSADGGNSSDQSAKPFQYVPAHGQNTNILRNHAATATSREFATQDAGAGGLQTEQKAYDKGLAHGEARARAEFEKAIAELRSQISEALKHFTVQRETYFERVETDVVGLALAIARKILHREAQIDPLLLTGIVRVALENISHETRVHLRVNPQEIRFWREYFSQTHEIHPVPELLGDASLTSGQCVLETDVGNTQISLETQLKEIEQGFLDLLQQRPRVQE